MDPDWRTHKGTYAGWPAPKRHVFALNFLDWSILGCESRVFKFKKRNINRTDDGLLFRRFDALDRLELGRFIDYSREFFFLFNLDKIAYDQQTHW